MAWVYEPIRGSGICTSAKGSQGALLAMTLINKRNGLYVAYALAGGCLALVSPVSVPQDSDVLVVHGHVPAQCTLYLNNQPVTMVTFSLANDLSNEQTMTLGDLEFDCNHRGPVELLTSVMPPHGNDQTQQRPVVQLSYAGQMYRADSYGYLYVSQIDQPITLSIVNNQNEVVVAGIYRVYLQVLGD